MKKAFTIIETLVAITILMIAIAGPLTTAFRALSAAYDAREQMVAINLATEVVETVRNIVDGNIYSGRAAGVGMLYGVMTPQGGCTAAVRCRLDMSRAWGSVVENPTNTNSPTDGTFLVRKVRTTGQYTHVSGADATPYYRSFYFQNITSDYAELVVDVVWTKGAFGRASTTLRLDMHKVAK